MADTTGETMKVKTTGSTAPSTGGSDATAKPKREKPEGEGGRIVRDKELVAMQDVSDLLDNLDEKMRKRVVQWVADRYGHLIEKPV